MLKEYYDSRCGHHSINPGLADLNQLTFFIKKMI